MMILKGWKECRGLQGPQFSLTAASGVPVVEDTPRYGCSSHNAISPQMQAQTQQPVHRLTPQSIHYLSMPLYGSDKL